MYQTFNKTAKNLRNIADKCNIDFNIIDKHIVKNCTLFHEIPMDKEWRIPFLISQILKKKKYCYWCI